MHTLRSKQATPEKSVRLFRQPGRSSIMSSTQGLMAKRLFILVTREKGQELVPIDSIAAVRPRGDKTGSVLLVDGMPAEAITEIAAEVQALCDAEWDRFMQKAADVTVEAALKAS